MTYTKLWGLTDYGVSHAAKGKRHINLDPDYISALFLARNFPEKAQPVELAEANHLIRICNLLPVEQGQAIWVSHALGLIFQYRPHFERSDECGILKYYNVYERVLDGRLDDVLYLGPEPDTSYRLAMETIAKTMYLDYNPDFKGQLYITLRKNGYGQ